MRIEVTQEDIVNGLPGDCFRCAIALALFRYTSLHFAVNEIGLQVEGDDIVEFPSSAQQFVIDFDDGVPVQPFTFNLSAECFMYPRFTPTEKETL